MFVEAEFLLTTPVRAERIVLHKFQEAIVFSSWGFLLLGSPMLVAYGYAVGRALVLFRAAAAVHGRIHLHSRRHRRHPVHVLRASLGADCAVIFLAARSPWPWSRSCLLCWSLLKKTESNLLTPVWFQEMLGRLQFSEHRLLPSWWLSSGLLEAARDTTRSRHSWAESLLFLSLLISNALFLRVLVVGVELADLSRQLQRAANGSRDGSDRASDSGSTGP